MIEDRWKFDGASKFIIVSCVISFISLFLPWNIKLWQTMNAFIEGEFILFIPYFYPFIKTLRKKRMNSIVGSVTVILPIGLTLPLFNLYLNDRYQDPQYGMYLFMVSSLVLIVGFITKIRNI